MKASKGLELWEKANGLIPGGNMLLSKHKNLFSPGKWPCYYSKAKGAKVWDLDGNEYIDFTHNGVGAVTLGYAYDPVDLAVKERIDNSTFTSLNNPQEVQLAEKLVSLHPWADMVRFARSGGEANAIAIRIARAFTGKDKVAICGYHGWHDWYLAANISDKTSLNDHLMDGLSIAGVPQSLKGTVVPIRYNNFQDLDLIALDDEIGTLKMEVVRSVPPLPNYLEKIQQICNDKGIVLILDECTSGFRESFGGIHLNYNITPDLCMFGKALGNGYAVTAVVGRSQVMNSACKSFISSTFWTEGIGTAAAIATLAEMERLKSWTTLPLIGKRVKDIWQQAAADVQLNIELSGINALPTFTFINDNTLACKTLFVELMLERGFLASTQFYPTLAHNNDRLLAEYQTACHSVLGEISSILTSGRPINDFCSGEICRPTFQRLN